MIGLVIASHGKLAEEMLVTARQIVGEVSAAASVSIPPGLSLDTIRDEMRRAVDSVDAGQGVLVFVDLLGGTPCNQSLMLCQQRRMEVLTGVNLPMLIKAHSLRGEVSDLAALAQELIRYGQKNIACASSLVDSSRARDVR